MKKFSHNNRFFCSPILIFPFCFILLLSLSGCTPLKKKFIRQKSKDKKEEFVPVLEPIEYPAATETALGLYSQHFTLWKMWFKDLMAEMDESVRSDKRIVYNVNQLSIQLEEMQKLLSEESKPGFLKNIDIIRDIQNKMDRPSAFWNMSIIKSQLISIDRQIRRQYNPKKGEDFLVK